MSQVSTEVVQLKQDCKCDFSRYNPLVLSHPLVNATTKMIEPDYPEIAKRAKVEGTVEVRILVNRNGEVKDACVVEGPPLL
ncbi:MAG TPA: TonB family protein [Pyrinomonadaceae bacterium]|nr:TonB family protein [Pyrinomonadaceae bacterium]